MKNKDLYFVIAYEQDGHMIIYAFGNEIHHNSLRAAKDMLAYVKRQEPSRDWKIYQIKFEMLKG